MNQALENGIELDVAHVVAADAISKIAGIDLKTTIKVFNALFAVNHAFPAIAIADLVNPDRTPSAPADDVRFNNTEDFVVSIIHNLQKTNTGRVMATRLRLDKRMGKLTAQG